MMLIVPLPRQRGSPHLAGHFTDDSLLVGRSQAIATTPVDLEEYETSLHNVLGPFLEINTMQQLLRFALVPLFVAGVCVAPVQAADTRRPNILFIFADDHGYQAISAYNDPRKLLDTPNLDR